MSTKDTAGKDDNEVSICANCGKSEEESHKLKHCNACKMVKYIAIENVRLLTVHNIKKNAKDVLLNCMI